MKLYIFKILIITISISLIFSCDQNKNKMTDKEEWKYNLENNIYDEDITPPELLSLDIEPKSVKGGDKILIKIGLKEEGTGIDYLGVDLYSPNKLNPNIQDNNFTMGIKLVYNSEEDLFIGESIIYEYLPSGRWAVGSIYIKDRAENTRYYRIDELSKFYKYNLSDMKILSDVEVKYFYITDTKPDITPPIINDIYIENNVVNRSGMVKIIANAHDDYSGINSIRVIFQSPTSIKTGKRDGKDIYFFLNKISNNIWEDINELNHYMESGIWLGREIYISDNAGNYVKYIMKDDNIQNYETYYINSIKTDIEILEIDIRNTYIDKSPPTIQNITINKEVINTRGTIYMTAIGKESGSRIDNIVVSFYSPSRLKYNYDRGITLYCILSYNSEKELWEGNMNVESFHEKGEWKAGSITVYDEGENYTTYRLGTGNYYEYNNNYDFTKYKSDIRILGFIKK